MAGPQCPRCTYPIGDTALYNHVAFHVVVVALAKRIRERIEPYAYTHGPQRIGGHGA
jgi:hypothetical protein